MAHRIVLHVGPRKTGSTFLQHTLTALSPALLEHGVLYPTRIGKFDRYNHVSAVFSLDEARMGRRGAWSNSRGTPLADLVRQIDTFPGVVILSAEALGGLQPSAVRALLARLPDVPVHAIACARALPAVFLSSWAQHVANTNRISLDGYVEMRVRQREALSPADREVRWNEDPGATFWRSYYYPGLARRWSALVDRFSVITVPASTSDKTTLWSRFRTATELDALPEVAPQLPARLGNATMSMAELQVLLAINREADARGLERKQIKMGTVGLSKREWVARDDRGPRANLPEKQVELISSWTREDARELASVDVPVIGDLMDLTSTPVTRYPEPTASDVATAAGTALAWAVLKSKVNPSRRERIRRRLSGWVHG